MSLYCLNILFEGNFVPSSNISGDYTVFKIVFTGFLGKYLLKHCLKSAEQASIFSKLQA